ncbi:MAG: transcriptional regulator [Sulfuritalea sp.]|jgi:predicted ArsR family transcriptional regulator|nr:transcriptional regulator [Sulfuritalea sp.]
MSTALPSLDPLLHQPVRTQIAAYLAGRGETTFAELKRVLGVTDGNLDAHLGKLTEAGYVESRREAQPVGRPATVFSLTNTGRQSFAAYVATLSTLLSAAPQDAAPAASLDPLPSH